MKRVSRYLPSKTVTIDGHKFDSSTEAARYGQLKLRMMAHDPKDQIRALEVHPRLPMVINGKKIGRGYMILDFSYEEWADGEWRRVYEDTKASVDTYAQSIRRQVCEAVNGIKIRVISV